MTGEGCDHPVFEGWLPGTPRWVVIYAAPQGALDWLVWEGKRNGAEVILGSCLCAGRWRRGTWLSLIGTGVPHGQLTALLRSVVSDATST